MAATRWGGDNAAPAPAPRCDSRSRPGRNIQHRSRSRRRRRPRRLEHTASRCSCRPSRTVSRCRSSARTSRSGADRCRRRRTPRRSRTQGHRWCCSRRRSLPIRYRRCRNRRFPGGHHCRNRRFPGGRRCRRRLRRCRCALRLTESRLVPPLRTFRHRRSHHHFLVSSQPSRRYPRHPFPRQRSRRRPSERRSRRRSRSPLRHLGRIHRIRRRRWRRQRHPSWLAHRRCCNSRPAAAHRSRSPC
jgi:hypothetical protein